MMTITSALEHGLSSTQVHFYKTKELVSPGNDVWHLGTAHLLLNCTKDFSKLGRDFKHLALGKVQPPR